MSKRFGRNQRRKMRERVSVLQQKLDTAKSLIITAQHEHGCIPRAHQSHRTYFGGKLCMNCGCALGSSASVQPCAGGYEVMKQQRDELLEALEFILDDCSRMVPKGAEDKARAAIARVKGGAA